MRLAELCPETLPEGLDQTEDVFIGKGTLELLPDVMNERLGKRALAVADPDTLSACRRNASSPFSGRLELPIHLLPRRPCAEDAYVAQLVGRSADMDGLVSVGSGTLNDITKLAATRLSIPYICVATAASMNGYTSGIAAVLIQRLKTTLPARPPRAVIMDIDVLTAAPPELNRAGLGDLLSKPVSMADYWLSDQLEKTGYTSLPARLVDHAMKEAKRRATGLRTNEPEAIEALARALILSGLSMLVAGSSRPASGGEHLISHWWDMQAMAAGSETRLHGAQVGIATCMCAALYHRLLRLHHPSVNAPPPWEAEERRIRAQHGSLADAILDHARRKHQRSESRLAVLRRSWSRLRDGLSAMCIPTPSQVAAPLVEAGAPRTLADLGLSREDAFRSLLLARDIRDRVTVLDLAHETGLLPDAAEQVLDEAGV